MSKPLLASFFEPWILLMSASTNLVFKMTDDIDFADYMQYLLVLFNMQTV